MNAEKQICKLMIVDTFGYNELKEILDLLIKLEYKITFVDNGNIIIEKEVKLE